MTYEEIETRIERYTNYMGNLIELVRLPLGTIELERDDGGGDLALAAVYFLRVGKAQVSSGETITREEAWRRCLAAYEALHGPHEKTTTSAEDVEVERQRLARKAAAEERQGEPESAETPAPDTYPCDLCGEEGGGTFGVCAACEETLEADLSGEPRSTPAAPPEDSRGAWLVRQLAGLATLARKHGLGEEAIARAVGAQLAPLNAEIERLRGLAGNVKMSVASLSSVVAEAREMFAALETAQRSLPNKPRIEDPAETSERVNWVGFLISGEMKAEELNDYIHSLHQSIRYHSASGEEPLSVAQLEEEIERAREEERDKAAREYDGRVGRACAQLEEEIEELRGLLDAAGLDPGARGEEAEEALARSLAPLVRERRAQRLKWSAAHDDKNGRASWTATLLALVADYGRDLYGYDHGEHLSSAEGRKRTGRILLARIGAVAMAALDADNRKAAEEGGK